MKPLTFATAVVALAACLGTAHAQDDPQSKPSAPSKKKVLVELFTSQGCNSCPSANQFLAQLDGLGYGPDRVVPVAFHVDYFNTPWVDPFSKEDYSRREQAYNAVLNRKDLYFTPMMMVDGRSPMLGSDRPVAFKALKRSLDEKPGVSINLAVAGQEGDRVATLDVAATSGEVAGRPLMIGLAVTEGPITTRVTSGENAGSALVEPFVARSFAFQAGEARGERPGTLHVPDHLAGQRSTPSLPGRRVRPGLGRRQGLSGRVDPAGREGQGDDESLIDQRRRRRPSATAFLAWRMPAYSSLARKMLVIMLGLGVRRTSGRARRRRRRRWRARSRMSRKRPRMKPRGRSPPEPRS